MKIVKIAKTLLAAVSVFAVLAASAVHAGSLAPAPRVIATLERAVIERSGAQTLQEFLDTGIARYFLTGGQSLLVMVNGRPYATTSSNLDTLPLSSVERVELLSGDSLGTLGASAVRGAINVVLREDLEGFETRGIVRMPSRDGGEGFQGSVFWGGAVGKGRMTLGVDAIGRQEITSQSRDFSRSEWREGGAFNETQNVSVGGNTVWVIQRDDETGTPTGERSIALGDCDPAKGYTGPLSNPPGITSGDKGCGFAYGKIMWNSDSYEQQSAILNLEFPLEGEAELRVDANVSRSESAFRYAPSIDTIQFTPNASLLATINDTATDFTADDNDWFVVAHRFVGHGNRDWLMDTEEYDLSATIEGRIREGLGYEARISAFRLDGFDDGNTFVHRGTIQDEVRSGNYDLANPFSDAPEHLAAITNSSLRLENDFGGQSLGARLALEGSRLPIAGYNAAWTAGFELGRTKAHDISRYRNNKGATFDVSEVLGSGGESYRGERSAGAAFAELSVPLTADLELRLGGRRDEYDDIGGLWAWRLGAEYRLTDIITLRSSWSVGDSSPSMRYLYSDARQDHPYIECDPGAGPPPRSCPELNPLQVTRVTKGNPELDPSESDRFAVGAEARRGPFHLGVGWYRLSRSGLPGQNSADWAMQNLRECMPGETTNCIARVASDVTIHNGYANVVENKLSGVNTQLGMGFQTGWGVVGMRGTWRHVADTELRIAGEEDRLAIPRNIVRVGLLGRRGGLSAIWTTFFRSSYRNRQDTGTFKSWTGHDVVLEWARPLGFDGARITAGVYNVTDTSLSQDTANPHAVDGPTEADWGRTYFLTLNLKF